MMRFRPLAAFAFALFLTLSGTSPLRAATGPVATVETFHGQLLAVMKEASSTPIKARFDRLAPTMDKTFDLKRMIQVASTPQWASADEAQRNRLLSAFRQVSIATYASQFDGYTGEKFETVGERPGPQSTALVETRIVEENGNTVGLTYVLKQTGDRWLIADILLDNSVSQLAVRRSEYRRILKDSGISGLIDSLDQKANELLAK